MNWYIKTMPTVKDASCIYKDICSQIKAFPGVKDVYIWGSLKDNINNPKYIIRDIDIIAKTSFNSEDLLAIDTGKYSPLKMKPSFLEDEGFCPQAVDFTKKYTSIQYNVDHWAISKDKKLLHWGAIPESSEDWIEIHNQAEKQSAKDTGFKREKLYNQSEEKKKEWKKIYDEYIKDILSTKVGGWFISKDKIDNILGKSLLVA